jgi:hypothetical protein
MDESKAAHGKKRRPDMHGYQRGRQKQYRESPAYVAKDRERLNRKLLQKSQPISSPDGDAKRIKASLTDGLVSRANKAGQNLTATLLITIFKGDIATSVGMDGEHPQRFIKTTG